MWINPADASTWIFIGYGSGFVAYEVMFDGSGRPSLSQKWATGDSGTSPVVAHSTVYYVSAGVVRAMDATSGATVWESYAIGGIHWQSPIVVNGRLYVFDATSQLWVYQLDGIFRNSLD